MENVGYYEYEYKVGVRDKVKEIETRMVSLGNSFDSDGKHGVAVQSNSSKPQTTASITKSIIISTEVEKKLNSNSNASSTKENLSIQQQPQKRVIDHLNKHPNLEEHVICNSSDCTSDHKPVVPMGRNNNKEEQHNYTTVPVPIPVPRKRYRQPVRSISHDQAIVIERDLFSASSGAGSRRSSEDDGIADMASESDPFDDSTMPLPKIKDNAFLLKDRRRSKEFTDTGEDEVDELNVPSPLLSSRRSSLNPQRTTESSDRTFPKSQRTRTDSTNSAENFVFRQISADNFMNRRESEAEVKIDTLHSSGSPLGGTGLSPIRSPVVVRSTTMSNSAASILVLGLPQSGKSATIDSLVQKRIANTGVPTVTPEIVEFTAKVKILDSTSLFNLKIIETPGYSNDPTISSDAQLMTTLVSYLESKEGLRGKPPTVVLVVFKFNDKRLWNPEDEHPDVVNFLKLIHNFQHHLNDAKYANFVFVLTHFLHESTSENDLRRPQNKVVELINLIQKYTSLPHPITVICAENQPKDVTFRGEQHQAINSTSPIAVALPNGEIFPYNLIEKIKKLLTKKGRDSVGETVLRTAFGIEYPYSIKECKITQKIPLVSPSHVSVQQMQKTLLHAYLDIERTEIFTLLEIGWENIPKNIRDKHPDSLFIVQQIFQTKKICQFEDIPEDPVKILSLVRQMPSNLAVKDLLMETLQLKVPACYPALFIGQGFDISKDTTTNVSPFLFSSGLKTSPVGLIPNEFECKIRDDREICFKFFYTVEDYVSERLKDMNLRYSISPNSLSAMAAATAASSATGHQRWGYNLIKKNQEPSKSTIATAIIDYRVFQLTLHPQPEIEFKPQFWDAVVDIPDLDIKDIKSVSAWKEFFGYWGTHVVKSAFGGGSVEITFKGNILTKIFNSMKKDFILSSDEYETSRVFQWITGDGLDFVASCGKEVKNDFLQGYGVEAHFHGGDIKFQQVDLTKLESKEVVGDIREEWKDSLVCNPTMLDTNLVLVPLSYYVRQKSEGIATKIDIALHYFYSDFMVTQGKQSSCSIL